MRDTQTKAGAGYLVLDRWTTIEPLEYPALLIRRYSWAMVGDFNDLYAILDLCAHFHWSIGLRIFQCIVEKLPDSEFYKPLIKCRRRQ